MELDTDMIDAYWTKDVKGKPEFFIINEAIMSKLCILGEDVEPCFEGASISSVQFSFDDSFKSDWTNMMNQMREILKNEGGAPVFKYTVNSTSDKASIENYISSLEGNYSLVECYSEEDQDFAVLQNDDSFFRMNYSFENDSIVAEDPEVIEYSREHGFDMVRVTEIVESVSCVHDDEGHEVEERVVSTVETTKTVCGPIEEDVEEEDLPVEEYSENSEVAEENNEYALSEQPVAEAVEEIAEVEEAVAEYAEVENAEAVEEPVVDFAEAVEAESEIAEDKAVVEFAEVAEEVAEVEETVFSVYDSAEYIELQNKLNEVEANYSAALGLITELKNEKEALNAEFSKLRNDTEASNNVIIELKNEINNLNEFKLSVEREKKMALIDKFYMLDDADKKDVIENVDTYSLDDIEAKLCVVCFRNRISFEDVENEQPVQVAAPVVYNLNVADDGEDLSVPAWVKAVRATQKSLDN